MRAMIVAAGLAVGLLSWSEAQAQVYYTVPTPLGGGGFYPTTYAAPYNPAGYGYLGNLSPALSGFGNNYYRANYNFGFSYGTGGYGNPYGFGNPYAGSFYRSNYGYYNNYYRGFRYSSRTATAGHAVRARYHTTTGVTS